MMSLFLNNVVSIDLYMSMNSLSIFTKVLINVRRLAQKALMIELFKALELFPNTLQILTIDPITGQRHRGMFENAKMNEKKKKKR